MAVVAEQHQSVGHRHQDERADRLRLVDHRNGGSRVRSDFGPIGQFAALASHEQRQTLVLQSANGDSSRAGQWDNSQGFIGFSHWTYGTLTGGRVNTLSLDGLIAYDPMGSAYAFSPFGFTGMYAGFGDP